MCLFLTYLSDLRYAKYVKRVSYTHEKRPIKDIYRLSIDVYTHTHTRTRTHIYMYKCTYIYVYIHNYIYIQFVVPESGELGVRAYCCWFHIERRPESTCVCVRKCVCALKRPHAYFPRRIHIQNRCISKMDSHPKWIFIPSGFMSKY